jgi:hypothetical protein
MMPSVASSKGSSEDGELLNVHDGAVINLNKYAGRHGKKRKDRPI